MLMLAISEVIRQSIGIMNGPETTTGDWRHKAVCKGEDPELFFPVHVTTKLGQEQQAEAKAVCKRCSVVDICLKWAIETGQDAGVWGGMGEDERRVLKRRIAKMSMQQSTNKPTWNQMPPTSHWT